MLCAPASDGILPIRCILICMNPAILFEPQKVIFTAMSKRSFYLREHIIKYVLEKGYTPMCAFMMFSYFLLDTVDRVALIRANNDLIRRSDELWVFGPISDGVVEEIKFATELKMPILYFRVGENSNIFTQIEATEADLELYHDHVSLNISTETGVL